MSTMTRITYRRSDLISQGQQAAVLFVAVQVTILFIYLFI